MKQVNKQAALVTLATGNTVIYLPKTQAQIRALTVYNPTASPVDLSVDVGGKILVAKTVTANATEIISALFNQQLKKDEPIKMQGEGLNVMMTVVEITE